MEEVVGRRLPVKQALLALVMHKSLVGKTDNLLEKILLLLEQDNHLTSFCSIPALIN